MITTLPMALAALTVMMWLIWSESIRSRRSGRVLYFIRVALFLAVSAIVATRLVRHPQLFDTGSKSLLIVTILVGLAGAYFFARRAMRT